MKLQVLTFIILLIITACQPRQECDCNAAHTVKPYEKWTWSEERFEQAVNKVRAGRDLTPDIWPNESKIAVLLSFDVTYEEGTMFLLTMHPHYIGHRSRIVVLKELIEYINVWFGTPAEAASYVKEKFGM